MALSVLFWELLSGVPPFKTIELADIVKKVISGERETPIDHTENYHSLGLSELLEDEALVDSNRLLAINPDDAVSLGKVFDYNLGRYEESLADLSRSLKIDPNNAEALSTRGQIYFRMNRYEESLADLTNSLKIKPDHLNTYEEALIDLNKFEEIEQNEAITLKSHDPTYYEINKESPLQLAVKFCDLLYNKGSYDESQESPLELTLRCCALKIRPNSEFTLLGRWTPIAS
ncbi:hypothetical protein C2G38_2254401 [Gigaspora rosea]|uniref:Uncharacterized protein n=1 Tax=Gigaspora rosea TaxID=44941 RepID=A0A397U2D9_9GLOM|nr:hypothetical protein C2G38_2254401 [Gigaspora rosea]